MRKLTHHRQGHALLGDPQDQEVDLGLAECPVGAVQGQILRAFAHRKQMDQQPGQSVVVDPEVAKEAL